MWCSVLVSRNGKQLAFCPVNDVLFAGTDQQEGFASHYIHSSFSQLGADIDGEAAGDWSGFSVSISADGSRVAIGALFNDGSGVNAGHVRVYEYHNSAWVQIGADIDGDSHSADDRIGYSVSISADGSRLAVGAPGNDAGGSDTGNTRVYEYNNGAWMQIGADIPGEARADLSGRSVSISSDGSRVAIGAIYNDATVVHADSRHGHVRVYEDNNGAWAQVGADIDGEAAGDLSGWSVSISDDGSRVAVGAIWNDGNGAQAGHVRIYEYNSPAWMQIGVDIDGETAPDVSGWAVSMSADGNRVAIGAILNDGGGVDAGHVRVYEYHISAWVQIGADIDGEAAGDRFGSAVSISADGNRVAIGDGRGAAPGRVRVYEYYNSEWVQIGDIGGEAAGDFSGHSVSISADGSRVAIGAIFNDDGGVDAGHVRVYRLSGQLSLSSMSRK